MPRSEYTSRVVLVVSAHLIEMCYTYNYIHILLINCINTTIYLYYNSTIIDHCNNES